MYIIVPCVINSVITAQYLLKFKLYVVVGCDWLCWSWNYTRSKTGETSNASLM